MYIFLLYLLALLISLLYLLTVLEEEDVFQPEQQFQQ